MRYAAGYRVHPCAIKSLGELLDLLGGTRVKQMYDSGGWLIVLADAEKGVPEGADPDSSRLEAPLSDLFVQAVQAFARRVEHDIWIQFDCAL